MFYLGNALKTCQAELIAQPVCCLANPIYKKGGRVVLARRRWQAKWELATVFVCLIGEVITFACYPKKANGALMGLSF